MCFITMHLPFYHNEEKLVLKNFFTFLLFYYINKNTLKNIIYVI